MLRINGITKRLGSLTVLDSITHNVRKGRITAIVGPNGAGKTTLFNIIMGIYPPEAGTVILGKRLITGLKTHQIANLGMSMLFQQNMCFRNLSIRDHLLLCRSTAKKTKEVMELVALNRPINTPARELSYGQKKLLGIAIVLLRKHSVLLLDEPVAGVNPLLKDKVREILIKLKQNNETILLIEHDMDFIRKVADEIVVLDNGRIISTGSFEKIMADRQVVKSFIGSEKKASLYRRKEP